MEHKKTMLRLIVSSFFHTFLLPPTLSRPFYMSPFLGADRPGGGELDVQSSLRRRAALIGADRATWGGGAANWEWEGGLGEGSMFWRLLSTWLHVAGCCCVETRILQRGNWIFSAVFLTAKRREDDKIQEPLTLQAFHWTVTDSSATTQSQLSCQTGCFQTNQFNSKYSPACVWIDIFKASTPAACQAVFIHCS